MAALCCETSGRRALNTALVVWLACFELTAIGAAAQTPSAAPQPPAVLATEAGRAPLSNDVGLTVLTYPQAIERATADTPRMTSARAAVQRAEAQVQGSRAQWLPAVNGLGNFTRLDDDRRIGDRITQPANSLNLSGQLLVPLLVPARWVDTARQRDTLEATKEDAENARRLAIVDVTRAYLAVALEKQALEIAERALETSHEQAEIVRHREREGVTSRLEVVRAEREVHTNAASVAARRAGLRTAQEALGVATLTDGPADTAGDIVLATLPTLSDALASLDQRPDLVSLQKRLAAARARVEDGWLDYAPTLNVDSRAFYQSPPTVNFPQLGWQVSLLLQVPLYDGGRRRSDQRLRQADRLEATANLREAALAARAEVRSTAAEADHRYAAWLETLSSVQLSQQALALARTAFTEGTGTQIDLIEAERSSRDAETDALVAQTAFLQAQLLYRLAAGQM